jgi:hypothetical protein
MPASRRPQTTRASAGQPASSAGSTTQVGAFGDSLMWGQGLNRNERFTELITALLPAILGQPAVVAADASRSGAQIRGVGDQRKNFVDTFPALFASARERTAFLDGKGDRPATGLYGENPAPFPTVRGQVDLLSAAEGKAIDVALVDGGINDIAVEDIVNPAESPGEFVERWDGDIRRVGHDYVLELLLRVRRKCPKAVILYFGFFAPLSYLSSTSKLRDLFEYETDDTIGWFVNGIFGCEDVNAAILAAQTRATWLQGRWQYWTRQAVVDANQDDAVRGPGVLFIPSGFGPNNSGFARAPFIFDDYRDPTTDPAQPVRRRNIPRIEHLDEMEKLYFSGLRDRPDGTPPREEVDRLEAALDGPSSLKAAMHNYVLRPFGNSVQVLFLLRDDILRIRHALIASAGHPLQQGARSYADNAIRRLREHRDIVRQVNLEQRPGHTPIPGQATLDALLRRYKLRGLGSLHADVGDLDVDSLAVRVVTGADSDPNFFPDVWLVVTTKDAAGKKGRRQYLLNFVYRVIVRIGGAWVEKPYAQFEPGATNRFTVDPLDPTTGRTLRLDEITGCALLVGGDRLKGLKALKAYGKVWRPDVVRLEVNGHQVVDKATAGQQFGFFSSMDLSYPESQPGPTPPKKLAPVTVKAVKQLGPRVNARRALAPAALLDGTSS